MTLLNKASSSEAGSYYGSRTTAHAAAATVTAQAPTNWRYANDTTQVHETRSIRLFWRLRSRLDAQVQALAQRWTIDPSIEAQATLTNNANYEQRRSAKAT